MAKIRASLFLKLALLILLSTGAVLAMVTHINNTAIRYELVQNQQALYTALSSGSAKEIELFFSEAARAVDSAALSLKREGLSAAEAEKVTQTILSEKPEIYGAAVALSPSLPAPHTRSKSVTRRAKRARSKSTSAAMWRRITRATGFICRTI